MIDLTMSPIGTIRSTRLAAEDDDWDNEVSSIELDSERFTAEAVAGLPEFSHVEVVYVFHGVDPARVEIGARHPRNRRSWPSVGIFAQRAKNRPNRIGTTICRLLSVDGVVLRVAELDAIDGTPVLDLKPWVREFGPRGDVKQPAWMTELMTSYWVR